GSSAAIDDASPAARPARRPRPGRRPRGDANASGGRQPGGIRPAEVVVAALDVVLSEIRPVLDLDDQHGTPPRRLEPRPDPPRDLHGRARPEAAGRAGHDDARRAAHDDPRLRAVLVALEAEPPPGVHEEPLDLVARALGDRLEAAPRARLEAGARRRHGGGA